MKVSTTAERLKKIMLDKNIRAVDLVNMCQFYCKKYNIKMGKNDISQYLSGKVEPSQKKLTVLANALDVDEVYLMGYDTNEDSNHYSELDILFDKHKDILTDGDKAIIKAIIEERKREIDKELGNIE